MAQCPPRRRTIAPSNPVNLGNGLVNLGNLGNDRPNRPNSQRRRP